MFLYCSQCVTWVPLKCFTNLCTGVSPVCQPVCAPECEVWLCRLAEQLSLPAFKPCQRTPLSQLCT